MKILIILAITLVWLGCLAEVTVLASAALRLQHPGSITASVLLLGWLGLTAVCAWKFTRLPRPAAPR